MAVAQTVLSGAKFLIEIREIKARGIALAPWTTIVIPRDAVPVMKANREVYGTTFKESSGSDPDQLLERSIPARGEVSVYGLGNLVHKFQYGSKGEIASVRSKKIDKESTSEFYKKIVVAAPGGLVRIKMPSTKEDIEKEFEGYGILPDEKWVQLNPTRDPYVVQVKIVKIAPRDALRDLQEGTYYIYAITRCVINVPIEVKT